MIATAVREKTRRLVLEAERAADLMTGNPISIRGDATIREAMNLLTLRGISAVPVIDSAGRPVGVASQTDLLIHERNRSAKRGQADVFESSRGNDTTLVRDVMTPAVFSVRPETPARTVVEELLQLRVHRLFVVDHAGVLLGVISMTDVLRRLSI